MTYDFPPHETTDTMNAVEFQLRINDAPVNLTGAGIQMSFVLHQKERVMNLGTGLTLTDAVNGKFKIDEQIIEWEEGVWHYEVQFTFADGRKKTYLKGTLKITD